MALAVGDCWQCLSQGVTVKSLAVGRDMKCRGEASQELLHSVQRDVAPGGLYGGCSYSKV